MHIEEFKTKLRGMKEGDVIILTDEMIERDFNRQDSWVVRDLCNDLNIGIDYNVALYAFFFTKEEVVKVDNISVRWKP